MAHTPGPWRVFAVDNELGNIRYEIDTRRGASPDEAEIEANRRLIETAPDLLRLAHLVAAHFKDTDAPLGILARDLIAEVEGKR